MSRVKERMTSCTLIKKTMVSKPELALFQVQSSDEVFNFKPGQYATLGMDIGEKFVVRPYSIASAPENKKFFEFYITRVKDGEFTPIFFELKEGDPLYIMGPKGKFTLDKATQPHLLMIATGTGLAPFMSMIRSLKARFGKEIPHSITVMEGNSFRHQFGYWDELQQDHNDPNFPLYYLPTISRPHLDKEFTEEWAQGRVNDVVRFLYEKPKSGRVDPKIGYAHDKEAIKERLKPEETSVFICGNPDMIEDLVPIFEEHHFAEIFKEDYW